MALQSCPHINPLIAPVQLPRKLHPYAHGGGYGIATEALAHPVLAEVLRGLEPTLYKRCDHILNKHGRVLNAGCARQITLATENSPVIAALARFKLGPIPIEWDIWLDPELPSSMEKAVILHGGIFATLFGKQAFMRSLLLRSAPSVASWVRIYDKAIRHFSRISNCAHVDKPALCLDIKSAWSTASDINQFIVSLKGQLGFDVRYVGSFSFQQIARVEGAEKILFCHALRDLQVKVASGDFPECLMLNGADLEDPAHLETLRGIQASHRLKLGVYVQEPEANTYAVQQLIRLVTENRQLFGLGFALGNRGDGLSPRMIEGSGAGVQKPLLTNTYPKIQRMVRLIAVALCLIILGLVALV